MRKRRIRVQAYGISKSAKALANYLEVFRLKNPTRFRARPTDIIINWGIVKEELNATYLNPLDSVRAAANKISAFQRLASHGVSVPEFHFSKPISDEVYVARTTVTGHSGQGIEIGEPVDLPEAPLYTKLIEKVAEYRAIVVGGEVVDFKQKLKKRGLEHHPHVWNHSGGYIFARNDINHPEQADVEAIKALEALNLNYGAVDLIEDSNGKIYVLEVNSAFGLEGTTTELVGKAIKRLIYEV